MPPIRGKDVGLVRPGVSGGAFAPTGHGFGPVPDLGNHDPEHVRIVALLQPGYMVVVSDVFTGGYGQGNEDPRFVGAFVPTAENGSVHDEDWKVVADLVGSDGITDRVTDEMRANPGLYALTESFNNLGVEGYVLVRHERYRNISPEAAEILGPDNHYRPDQYKLIENLAGRDDPAGREAHDQAVKDAVRMIESDIPDAASRIRAAVDAIDNPGMVRRLRAASEARKIISKVQSTSDLEDAAGVARDYGLSQHDTE
jgi:hypothetical protein